MLLHGAACKDISYMLFLQIGIVEVENLAI